MRKLPYNNAAYTLRLEYPPLWNPVDITEPLLSIYDNSGNLLLEEEACSIYDDTTLSAAASQDDSEIVLHSTATAVKNGDRLRLVSSAGLSENVEVSDYTSVDQTATLKSLLVNDFASGSKVYGLFATVSLDLSDTTTYSKSKELTLVWDSGLDEPKVIERAIISYNSFQVPGLESRFSLIYPRTYDVLKQDGLFEQMVDEAKKQLTVDLKLRNMLIDRIPDSDLLVPCLLAKIRWLTLLSGDQSLADERQVTQSEYNHQFELLCNLPIWQDNGDLVKSNEEISSHEPFFCRGF